MEKLLKDKDYLNNLKILSLSYKIITYGRGYNMSNEDIAIMIQIMNGYLHLMERVKDYERKIEKTGIKQEIKKTTVRLY